MPPFLMSLAYSSARFCSGVFSVTFVLVVSLAIVSLTAVVFCAKDRVVAAKRSKKMFFFIFSNNNL